MRLTRLLIIFVVFMSMATSKTYAYDIAVNDENGVTLYYNIIYLDDERVLEVVGKKYNSGYQGNIVIPESGTYQ